MKFCPKCDNLLLVKREGKSKDVKILHCPACGHREPFDASTDRDSYTLKEEVERTGRDLTVVLPTRADAGRAVDEDDRDGLDDVAPEAQDTG